MKPMKPRPPGSACDALARMLAEVARSEGHEPTAGAKLAARFLGVSDSLLRKASDPDRDEDLGFRRVAMLTEHFRVRAAAEHLALGAGGLFVPMPDPGATGRLAVLGGQATRETGEAIAALIAAIDRAGPGGAAVTAAERRRLTAEVADVLRVFAELHGLLMRGEGGEEG
jgi:hypothetical protein